MAIADVLLAMLAVATLGTSVLLGAVSLLAAKRNGAVRFLFAGLAFLLFGTQSLLFIGDMQAWWTSPVAANAWTLGFDAGTLALLYLAIAKG